MYSILLDKVNTNCEVDKVIELANKLASASFEASLFLYVSDIDKKELAKLRRKKLENLHIIKVENSVSDEQVVKNFIIDVSESDIILVKRHIKLAPQLILDMINSHKNGNKIVSAKNPKQAKGIRAFSRKTRNLIFNLVYGFGEFDGDEQILLFDKTLVVSMKHADSSIVKMTKVDSYKLVDRDAIVSEDVEINKKYKSRKHSLKLSLSLTSFVLMSALMALLAIFVPAVRTPVFYIAFGALCLLVLVILFVFSVSFMLYKSVGNINDINSNIKKESL